MTDEHEGDVARVDGPGAAAVAHAIAPLADLDRTPLLEHAQVFEDVHAGLHRLLAEPER